MMPEIQFTGEGVNPIVGLFGWAIALPNEPANGSVHVSSHEYLSMSNFRGSTARDTKKHARLRMDLAGMPVTQLAAQGPRIWGA